MRALLSFAPYKEKEKKWTKPSGVIFFLNIYLGAAKEATGCNILDPVGAEFIF